MPTAVRWGIMGTASIAEAVYEAMVAAPSSQPVAIASRSLSKAQQWSQDRGGELTPYGSYEALLADEGVDAVYIPLPTTLHLEWVVKAAEAGKHVLVEKPVVRPVPARPSPQSGARVPRTRASDRAFL